MTEARLKEGDVAPLDVNLVKVEADRLKVQAIAAQKRTRNAGFEFENFDRRGRCRINQTRAASRTSAASRYGFERINRNRIAVNAPICRRRNSANNSARRELIWRKRTPTPNVAGSVHLFAQ